MAWNTRYKVKRFLRKSFSLVPISAIVAAMAAAPLIRWIDGQTQWRLFGVGVEGAKALVGTLPASLLSLIVFSLSIILLAVQIASSQYSARVIARVFETPILRWALGVFVFTHTYSLFALGRIEDHSPELPVLVALLMNLISLALFLVLIQSVGQSFRPIKLLTVVAADTKQVIEDMFPTPYSTQSEAQEKDKEYWGKPCRSIKNNQKAGVLVAFDQAGLVELAARQDCVVEFVVAVGEFVAEEQLFFCVHGAGAASITEAALWSCVALDVERTLDQDPAFGFRIIVDVASKALSPAINDPTTGVLAIDQIQHLLALLGQRQIDNGIVKDLDGAVRIVYPSCEWKEYVTLAVTEIRLYGNNSPQVTRRLQSMYDYLMQVLPESRAIVIEKERALLQQTIETAYANNQDRELAAISDYLGFGACRSGNDRRINK
ncbi:MAG: hypothetical protein H6Q65_1395 [Firmicutes bacterium]|nr:hypothetical protein [Bacillota bacterium]